MFSIAGMVAPIAFTNVFAAAVATTGQNGGLGLGSPFFAAALMLSLALGLAAWVTRRDAPV